MLLKPTLVALQGMTVGIMQAARLRDTAAAQLDKAAGSSPAAKRAALQGLSSVFHAELPEILDFPWSLATGKSAEMLMVRRFCTPPLFPEGCKCSRPASPSTLVKGALFCAAASVWRLPQAGGTSAVQHFVDSRGACISDCMFRVQSHVK